MLISIGLIVIIASLPAIASACGTSLEQATNPLCVQHQQTKLSFELSNPLSVQTKDGQINPYALLNRSNENHSNVNNQDELHIKGQGPLWRLPSTQKDSNDQLTKPPSDSLEYELHYN